MTTKTSKTTTARKSAKKSPSPKTAAPRKRAKAAPAAPEPVPVHDDEPVHYVHRGTTYELDRVDGGYAFAGKTFKSLAGFGKHLASLDGAPATEPAGEAMAVAEDLAGAAAEFIAAHTKAPARKRGKKAAAKAKRTPASNPRLAPGSTLTRTYKGQEIRVEVTDDGFHHDGLTYRSLTAVAKQITGYSAISGTAFFGLWKRTTPESE